MTEDDNLNLTTDEKLDLILSRLAALEADIAERMRRRRMNAIPP
jgi:hypothetical protein